MNKVRHRFRFMLHDDGSRSLTVTSADGRTIDFVNWHKVGDNEFEADGDGWLYDFVERMAALVRA